EVDLLLFISGRIFIPEKEEVGCYPVSKRTTFRFQSNHQRGYFWRKRIITRGARMSTPPPAPDERKNPRPSPSQPPGAPTPPALTRARTMAIGMTVKMRNAVVSRSSSRSG